MSSEQVPGIPSAVYKSATVNGNKYRYICAVPETEPIDTVLLVHGFPDLAIGWRPVINKLVSLNLRVIAPDQLGYGGTDAPEELEKYSLKNIAHDLAALVRHEVGSTTAEVILGGHDWGGFAAWRLAEWHPELVKAIFTICTPYVAPAEVFYDIDVIVKSGKAPSFGYQIQFRDGDIEKVANSRDTIRQFLAVLFGAHGPDGKMIFSTANGVPLADLHLATSSPLVSAEELDHHADEQARNGLRGPLNWYRTRKINFDDERVLSREHVFKVPAMFFLAKNDLAIRPEMSAGMRKHFENLTWEEVPCGHWAMVEVPEVVNEKIEKWLKAQKLIPSAHI
ncbi:hypothetical protein TD95_002614 [Thielaviopsis punctulata]|uniref:AB hydrolase-1 domain-containing protein n=1 Tax=Thielaviopsis punctulata TaxID=72032 RepID=A0A0F4ZK61_9PEZI|nr:hypothetical protein TD95_002614 [Thielaviopsis punctulata]